MSICTIIQLSITSKPGQKSLSRGSQSHRSWLFVIEPSSQSLNRSGWVMDGSDHEYAKSLVHLESTHTCARPPTRTCYAVWLFYEVKIEIVVTLDGGKDGHASTHLHTHTHTHTPPWRSGKTLVLLGRGSYRSQVRALVMEGLQWHIMDKLSRLGYWSRKG